MADVFGHSTVMPTTIGDTILYTCPIVSGPIDGGTGDKAEDIVTFAQQLVTQSQITSIVVCQHGATGTYNIYLTPDDATSSSVEYAMFYLTDIVQNDTDILSTGTVLAPGETLRCIINAGNTTTITVNYIEIS
jgi:hypothetical protein